jgi:catalase
MDVSLETFAAGRSDNPRTRAALKADGVAWLIRIRCHFKTDQGLKCLTTQEVAVLAGKDSDYHGRDRYHAIESGDYPSWTLNIQIMPIAEAVNYRFNPFDGWPKYSGDARDGQPR